MTVTAHELVAILSDTLDEIGEARDHIPGFSQQIDSPALDLCGRLGRLKGVWKILTQYESLLLEGPLQENLQTFLPYFVRLRRFLLTLAGRRVAGSEQWQRWWDTTSAAPTKNTVAQRFAGSRGKYGYPLLKLGDELNDRLADHIFALTIHLPDDLEGVDFPPTLEQMKMTKPSYSHCSCASKGREAMSRRSRSFGAFAGAEPTGMKLNLERHSSTISLRMSSHSSTDSVTSMTTAPERSSASKNRSPVPGWRRRAMLQPIAPPSRRPSLQITAGSGRSTYSAPTHCISAAKSASCLKQHKRRPSPSNDSDKGLSLSGHSRSSTSTASTATSKTDMSSMSVTGLEGSGRSIDSAQTGLFDDSSKGDEGGAFSSLHWDFSPRGTTSDHKAQSRRERMELYLKMQALRDACKSSQNKPIKELRIVLAQLGARDTNHSQMIGSAKAVITSVGMVGAVLASPFAMAVQGSSASDALLQSPKEAAASLSHYILEFELEDGTMGTMENCVDEVYLYAGRTHRQERHCVCRIPMRPGNEHAPNSLTRPLFFQDLLRFRNEQRQTPYSLMDNNCKHFIYQALMGGQLFPRASNQNPAAKNAFSVLCQSKYAQEQTFDMYSPNMGYTSTFQQAAESRSSEESLHFEEIPIDDYLAVPAAIDITASDTTVIDETSKHELSHQDKPGWSYYTDMVDLSVLTVAGVLVTGTNSPPKLEVPPLTCHEKSRGVSPTESTWNFADFFFPAAYPVDAETKHQIDNTLSMLIS